MRSRTRLARSALALVLLIARTPEIARGASTRKVAAIGDPAPGGGVFAGPSFVGSPDAAGDGWVAFRSLVADGASAEVLVVANMRVTSPERIAVAHVGREITPEIGTIKQFLGRPAVNANGDVAFAVTINPPRREADAPPPPEDFTPTTPAAILRFRHAAGVLEVIARSEDRLPGVGELDIATPVDFLLDPGAADVDERTPAINDAGDVAFLSTVLPDPSRLGAAILLRTIDGTLTPVVQIGDSHDGRPFDVLGPPALNASRAVAFRAQGISTAGGGPIDGIYLAEGLTVTRLLASGDLVPPFEGTGPDEFPQPVFEFGNVVDLNDLGHVAFTGGPFFDPSPLVTSSAESNAVFVHRDGQVHTVAWLGRDVARIGRISGIQLGDGSDGALAPPSLDAAGDVVFFVNADGQDEHVVMAQAADLDDLRSVVGVGGTATDTTPLGGFYAGASSAPAVDARGGVVFVARIAGTSVGEALVYASPGGERTTIRLGEPNPGTIGGFFAGPPFSAPVLNDAGDLVFVASVVGGTASRAVFRERDGVLEQVVRAGDPVDADGTVRIAEFEGQVGLNGAGAMVFTATLDDRRRSVLARGPLGLRRVLSSRDTLDENGTIQVLNVFANPLVLDSGDVVLRARLDVPDPLDPVRSLREEHLLLATDTAVTSLAHQGEVLAPGITLQRVRDPAAAGGPTIAFRAPLAPTSSSDPGRSGLFVSDTRALVPALLEQDAAGTGIEVTALQGRPAVDGSGNVAVLGRVLRGVEERSAILLRTAAGVRIALEAGTPGPAGGIFRGFSQPILSRTGGLAFRATFESLSGGTSGFFRMVDGRPHAFVQAGDGVRELDAPAPGARPRFSRFSSLGASASLNAAGELAFVATVSSGSRRSGVFLASPTDLVARKLTVRLRTRHPKDPARRIRPRDRVSLRTTMTLGSTSDGVDLEREDMTIWLSDAASFTDTGGAIYTAQVPRGSLARRGRKLTLGARSDARETVRSLKVVSDRDGRLTIALRSAPLDLRQFGFREIVPPLRVRVAVGDDDAAVTVPCTGAKTLVCAAD